MFRLIKRIFDISGKKKKDLYIANGFQLLQALFEGLLYLVIYFSITQIVSNEFSKETLIKCTGYLILVVILRYISYYQVNKYQSSAGYEIMKTVRIKESEKFKKLPLGVFQHQGMGDLTSIFTTDITFIEMHCMYAITRYVAGMSIVAMTSIVMFIIDWRLTCLAIIGFLPGFFVYAKSKNRLIFNGKKRHEAQQDCISAIIEYLNGMETIRTYNMTGKIYENILQKMKKYKEQSESYEVNAIIPMTIYQIIIRSGMGLLFVGGLMMYANKSIDLNVFIFFTVISTLYYTPIESIFHDFGTLNIMGVALDRLEKLKSEKELINNGVKCINDTSIVGKSISYKYANSKEYAIKNIDFEIKANTLNAIVGYSGSGKTTLLNLIARFFDSDKGKILISGNLITDIKYDNLVENISIVFQDSYLLEDTIFNNIKMGTENASREDVIAAAKAARCHDFISKYEEGYDTLIKEGGRTLSGGERQRVAIARAILKDVPIVLLDEAMSNIDAEKSWEIKRAIDVLTKDKTVIMIAHTLEYIKGADQIIMMKNGEIIEKGTHDSLLMLDREYKKMWELQQSSKLWKLKN